MNDGVYNEDGIEIGTYAYDAWGNMTVTLASGITSLESNIVQRYNPFRYRSYLYDSETNLYYLQSRYYSSEIGRFISADGVISGVGGELRGYNQFAYCFNNPVNMTDASGNWPKWIKNSIKWIDENIASPIVNAVEETLSKADLTYSTGLNASGTFGMWTFNAQIGVSMDTKGNIAVQPSFAGGITTGVTPSGTISSYRSITNAPSIDKLNGPGYQIGGSAIIPANNVPVAVSGDFNIIPDGNDRAYYGGTCGVGLGVGDPGGEFHAEWGNTGTIPSTRFNIFDVFRTFHNRIVEW